MTTPNNDDPAFYQKLDEFIALIPEEAHSTSKHPLLDNYLRHYNIAFGPKENCSRYEIWQSTVNGLRIIEHCWHPIKPNGRQLMLCHGYFDHTGLYGKLIRWALAQGYCLHSFDLPGHGLSSGERAAIDDFNEYSRILVEILNRENYPHCICIGQSTGCAVIVNAVLNPSFGIEETASPEKLILLAPLVRSIQWQHLRWLYLLLRKFLSSIKRGFVSSSHDKKFNHFLHHHDPLQSRRLPLRWLGAMDEWVRTIRGFAPNNHYPCFIIQGTGDKTVDYRYNLPQIQRCLPNTECFYVDKAYHHLANESPFYWEQVEHYLMQQES